VRFLNIAVHDPTYLAFTVTVSPTLLVAPIGIIHSQTPLRGMTIARDRSTNPKYISINGCSSIGRSIVTHLG